MKTNILFLTLILIIILSRWSWAEGEKIIPSADSELAATEEAEWSGFLNKEASQETLLKKIENEQQRSLELTNRYEKLLERNEEQAERYEQILDQYQRILNKWQEQQKAMDEIIAYWQGDIGEQE